jgi:outer membrane receptor protein involved in Fe transport
MDTLKRLAFGLIGCTAPLATVLSAETAVLEEVLVTAGKREQTLQDIPVAVTVTSAETLAAAQIRDVNDLQTLVPSLRVVQLQTSTQTNFLIRGFGNGANNPGIEPSVGVFIDGVYRSRSAAQIGDFFDIARVEVLRGPQTTLFGQNASAGVISVVTRLPEFEFGGAIEGTLGNFGTQRLRGRITGPLSERVAFSLAGNWSQRDGYFANLVSGRDINDRDRRDLRGQLLFNATEDLTFRVIADTSRIDELCCGAVSVQSGPTAALIRGVGGQIYTGDPFDRRAYLNGDPSNLIENQGISLHADWKRGNFDLTSITALRAQEATFDYDSDFTSANLVPTNLNEQDVDTFTQELRVAYDGGGRVRGLAGLFYFDERVRYDNTIRYGAGFRPYATGLVAASTGSTTVLPDLEASLGLPAGSFFGAGQGIVINSGQDNDSWTLFGNLDFDVTDRLTLSGGLARIESNKDVFLRQTNNDVFSALNLVQVGFAGAFRTLTGGLAPTPANFAAVPTAAAAADRISVTPCSATAPPPACNTALALYGLQFLAPVAVFNDGRSDDGQTTYTIKADFKASDAIRVYASVGTGFKATSWNLSRDSKPVGGPDRSPLGGFVNPYYARYGTRSAAPEDSRVIELGLKGQWSRAALYVAVFDQEIRGFQSNIFTGTGFNLNNAGKQSTQGLEIETQFRPDDHWEVSFAGTFLDPVYDSFPGAEGPNGPTDLTGTAPAGVHRRSLSTAVTYRWNIGAMEAFARADYLHESRVQVVENVAASIASREVNTINASLGGRMGAWDLLLWARNLNDDEYLLSAFPSVAQAGSISGYPNMPRSWGLTVSRSFGPGR